MNHLALTGIGPGTDIAGRLVGTASVSWALSVFDDAAGASGARVSSRPATTASTRSARRDSDGTDRAE
jgi:hypothetical protein